MKIESNIYNIHVGIYGSKCPQQIRGHFALASIFNALRDPLTSHPNPTTCIFYYLDDCSYKSCKFYSHLENLFAKASRDANYIKTRQKVSLRTHMLAWMRAWMHETPWAINVPKYTHSRCTQKLWRCHLYSRLQVMSCIHIYYSFIENYNWISKIYLMNCLLWYGFVTLCMHFICLWLIGQYRPDLMCQQYLYVYSNLTK